MAGASINDIKARIKSVEGTMQITKAMELVATSKLRHAKLKAENSKPYMENLSRAMSTVSSFLSDGESAYTDKRLGKTLYIVIAGDRGLAGGYNNNVMKLAMSESGNTERIFLPIGKKAREYVTRRDCDILLNVESSVEDLGVGKCMQIAKRVCEAFKGSEISAVKLVYTRFVSMLTQAPACISVLPLEKSEGSTVSDPIYEGDVSDILDKLMPQYIGGLLYASVCEAAASECAARRCAMNSANKNAEEMISTLVLKFNRARQAVITQEITEIVSGAEAL